jgi:hypothetical protein
MMNITRARQLVIVSTSITWLVIGSYVQAHAQSSCLTTELAKEMFSKAGIPVNEVQLLLLALAPASTAGKFDDQITQTNPKFSNVTGTQLIEEDAGFAKAQEFVKTLPLSDYNQNCIVNMQKLRDEIKTELNERDKENILRDWSPNQLRGFRNTQVQKANTRPYTPNNIPPPGVPRHPQPHPPPSGGTSTPPIGTGNGGGSSGTDPCGGAPNCIGTTSPR